MVPEKPELGVDPVYTTSFRLELLLQLPTGGESDIGLSLSSQSRSGLSKSPSWAILICIWDAILVTSVRRAPRFRR